MLFDLDKVRELLGGKSWMPPEVRRRLRQMLRVQKRQQKHATYASNGERECARRRAQIAAGRLTVANGLAVI